MLAVVPPLSSLPDAASRARLLSDPDLFAHADPKAAQEVLHFLFHSLDPLKCADHFRDCWPVLERRQEADFRKAANAWHKELRVRRRS